MRKKPIIIGVTGGSGGGKTSVSKAILANFQDQKIAMIQHDSYYKDQSHLTFEERVSTNYDHPLAFDTDLMIEHINELIAGRPVDIPIYDYTLHTRSEKTYRQEPQDVIIVEGILVLEDKRLRDLMDIKLLLILMTISVSSVVLNVIWKNADVALIVLLNNTLLWLTNVPPIIEPTNVMLTSSSQKVLQTLSQLTLSTPNCCNFERNGE